MLKLNPRDEDNTAESEITSNEVLNSSTKHD